MPNLQELARNVREAIAQEDRLRSYVYSGAPYVVAGIEVPAMTLNHFNLLCMARNPFVVGGGISKSDACQLLWVVCKDSLPWWRKLESVKSQINRFIKRLDLENVIEEVFEYHEEMFLDLMGGGGSKSTPIASACSYYVHRIASEYGWTRDQTMSTPLPELYQYLKLIRKDGDPKSPTINRLSDRAWVAYHKGLNAQNTKSN